MIYRTFGWTGRQCSAIGMGTYYDIAWILSSRLFHRFPGKKEILTAIRTGLEGGINLIDSAEIYASEGLVGEAIKGHDREGLFIATKAFPTHFTREKLRKACERSLSRLGLSYVDLYQLHFPSFRVPLQETMSALEELQEEGKIRYIGLSNFSLQQVRDATGCLRHERVAALQVHYSLLHREPEAELLQYCEENSVALLAYYPLAHGKLADMRAAQEIRSLMEKHGLTSMAQVSLTYLISRSNLVFPIPRARRSAHVRENTLVGESLFTQEEMQQLQKLFSS